LPEPIAYIEFLGGALRPVFEEPSGRQYAPDDEGEPVYGVWVIPREDCDVPVIVEGPP
jgi:hypothetical protein